MTDTNQSNLSQAELDERVAVLNRLRQLLLKQRSKFQEYLVVLEKQESSIIEEDAEKLLAHTKLEENIVGSITNLQHVIKPMEELYKFSHSNKDNEIPMLKTDLKKLQEQVLTQNEKNRTVLRKYITSIRSKINGLQNPYRNNHSVYAETKPTATIVDIET